MNFVSGGEVKLAVSLLVGCLGYEVFYVEKHKKYLNFYFDMLGKVVIFAPQFRAEAIIYIMEVGVGAFIYISVYMTL